MSAATKGLTRRSGRRGFTLVELSVTVMIVGILASVAAPAVQYAILKADAARLVGDAHTISLAGYEFLAENGRFPGGAGFGIVPAEFSGYLPDNYAFVYKDVEYRWYLFTFPNANNYWGTKTLGLIQFVYTNRPEMADPMYSYWAPDSYWSQQYFYFLYRG